MCLFRNTGFIFLIPIHWAVFGLLYLTLVIGLVFAGLDGVGPPIFGWILYPIEFIANTFVFPRAVTQVHGNGTALFFLSLLAALAYVVYRLGDRRPPLWPRSNPPRRRSAIVSGRGANVILFIAALVIARSAWAQSFTPDPGSWRPVAYTDLMFPVGEAEAYASIWQDRLDESNRRLASKVPEPNHRDMSLAVGNRAAREWHFTINFQSKLVVLSVLDTPIVCTDEYPSPSEAAEDFECARCAS